MHLLAFALTLAAPMSATAVVDTTRVVAAPRGPTAVRAPRIDAKPVLDGVLDEPMWRSAALLTGFTQFKPVDGVPAPDSTEVRIWYSPTALYVGVRAFDASRAVRATVSARDKIFADDNIQLLLSTFNDQRQATFLAVNPLGIQADGAINEGGGGKDGVDLAQDFVWESKGQVTPEGYVVELRIPFKSLRSQKAKEQTWGINVIRSVPRLAQEYAWMPIRQGVSSLLAQSGTLEGLTDLQTGHVLDIVPTITSSVNGSRSGAGRWGYEAANPEIGGSVRYGLTQNLTLNATANPDFSQVETDVTQFILDPREAVFIPERRPFFLDGIEQFDAPGNLIYTRRIVQPTFATKLTGKVGGTQLGFLGAVDDQDASRAGDDRPLFGIIRASRDLGPGSRLGAVWTERHDGGDLNRVVGVDGRVVVNKIHSFTFAGAQSHDERNGASLGGPIWSASYRLGARAFRTAYIIDAISDDFRTTTGFVGRAGIVNAALAHAYVWLRPGKTLQVLTGQVVVQGQWTYDDFVNGREMQNRFLNIESVAQLKSGWSLSASLIDENFGYDPSIYRGYALLNPNGTVSPWANQLGRIENRDYRLSVGSPNLKHFQVSGSLTWGSDVNFQEWAAGDVLIGSASLALRPTDRLRVALSYSHQQINRPSDGSQVLQQAVTRGRVEYQLSPAFQLRLVSEYSAQDRSALRDDSRTGLPIVQQIGPTQYAPAGAFSQGQLVSQFLFSYFPTPGTVVYLGYGATSGRVGETSDVPLARQRDGLFMKLSYLWRSGT